MLYIISEKIKIILRHYPITTTIVLVSTLIFAIHILLGEYGNYSRESIIALGGLDKELINHGEIWRLFTYTFGHMSSAHFIINTPILLLLSIPLERYYGSIKFLGFFLIITIVAGLSVYLFYQGPYSSLAGLSGTGYGFAGMLTLLTLRNPDEISRSYKLFIFFMLTFGIFSAFNTSSGIAISGHIGGFISGFVLSFIAPFLKDSKNTSKV